MIRGISIRDFRSIASANVECNQITIFVGANDAGKSNVLRALNLFFNGQVGFDEDFEFDRDYNQFASKREKKTPEIEIKLRFELPRGYRRAEYPEDVEWVKVWRQDGEVRDRESRKFSDGNEFPSRSKINALLDRVQFTYIPAIKDKIIFQDLQGQLYDVLSTVAAGPLIESASAFQRQLGQQLAPLLGAIDASFGGGGLRCAFRKIFERFSKVLRLIPVMCLFLGAEMGLRSVTYP